MEKTTKNPKAKKSETVISVIIPAYNAERTLSGTLDSIMACKSNDLQIIVVDDHSADKTTQIAKNYPVHLISLPKNSGPSFARNVGARQAVGRYIVFIDADIIVPVDAFELIRNIFKRSPEVKAVTGIYSIKTINCNLTTSYKHLYLCYSFLAKDEQIGYLNTSIAAIHRDLFFKLGGFKEDLRYGEDWELGSRIIQTGNKIFLHKKLIVDHIKTYSFLALLKNDFLSSISDIQQFIQFNKSGFKKGQTLGTLPKEYFRETFIIVFLEIMIIVNIFFPTIAVLNTLLVGACLVYGIISLKYWKFLIQNKFTHKIPVFILISFWQRSLVCIGAAIGIGLYAIHYLKHAVERRR